MKATMSIKSLAIASVLALSTFAINAQASLWTVTVQGQIGSGFDTSGVFGTAGQDLAGMLFTQSITASTDPAKWEYNYNGGFYQSVSVSGSGPDFTDTVTVNGHSATFVSNTLFGYQVISNGSSVRHPNEFRDDITTYQYGFTNAGDSLYIYQHVNNYSTAFVPTLDFAQTISRKISDPSFEKYSYFSISGNQNANFEAGTLNFLTVISGNQNANFEAGTLNFLTVNGSDIPEPRTYSMLFTGLGLMGFILRRRKTS